MARSFRRRVGRAHRGLTAIPWPGTGRVAPKGPERSGGWAVAEVLLCDRSPPQRGVCNGAGAGNARRPPLQPGPARRSPPGKAGRAPFRSARAARQRYAAFLPPARTRAKSVTLADVGHRRTWRSRPEELSGEMRRQGVRTEGIRPALKSSCTGTRCGCLETAAWPARQSGDGGMSPAASVSRAT